MSVPRLAVELGMGPCAAHAGNARPSSVLSTSTLLLLSHTEARWCPFCISTTAEVATCQVPPAATAGLITHTPWSQCQGSCDGRVSTRAQFCAVHLQAAGGHASEAATAVAVVPAAPDGTMDMPMTPGHVFPALLRSDACAHAEETLHHQRAQPCDHEHGGAAPGCGGSPSWQWLEVGSCSAACGGGMQRRIAKCVDAFGTWLPHNACPNEVPPQPPGQPCNSQPCAYTVWQVAPWGPCEPTGVRTREVTCVTAVPGQEAAVDPAECGALAVPVNLEACREVADGVITGGCAEGDCFKGSCAEDGESCVCEPGWMGGRCDAREECDGLVAESGECCAALRGADKQCCGAEDVLDRDGACCPAAGLDACRVCGGNATVVDLLGSCGTGVLDAAGMLCMGRLDECGVCDGTGLSCDMQARAAAAFVHASDAGTGQDEVVGDATEEARELIVGKLRLRGDDTLVLSAAAGGVQRAGMLSSQLAVAPLQVHMQFSPLRLPEQLQAAASTFWLRKVLDELVFDASVALGEDAEELQQEVAGPNQPSVQARAPLLDSLPAETAVGVPVGLCVVAVPRSCKGRTTRGGCRCVSASDMGMCAALCMHAVCMRQHRCLSSWTQFADVCGWNKWRACRCFCRAWTTSAAPACVATGSASWVSSWPWLTTAPSPLVVHKTARPQYSPARTMRRVSPAQVCPPPLSPATTRCTSRRRTAAACAVAAL